MYFRITIMFLSVLIMIQVNCNNSSGIFCSNDMDCPGTQVCRQNRCSGLYENMDILAFDDHQVLGDLHSDVVFEERIIEDINYDDFNIIEDNQQYIEDINYDDFNIIEDNQQYADCDELYDGDICLSEDVPGSKVCKEDSECALNKCYKGICIEGKCEDWYVSEGFCFVNGICYTDGEIDPANECAICNSRLNRIDFSNNDFFRCKDDRRECTYDICQNKICSHSPVDSGDRCSAGFCDGAGNCVECLSDDHCPRDNVDLRCESVYCEKNTGKCKYEKRGDGMGCAEWSNYIECFVCIDGKCVCNETNFRCDNCLPSCGVLKGNCCPQDSSCGINELDKSYDCDRCCEGECIPY